MDKISVLVDLPQQPYFPLKRYGYTFESTLNNKNRWENKIVCSILDKKYKRYVSTTYARQNDYLRLLETTTFLKCNEKLSPEIVRVYPPDRAIVCDYIGEFLSDYLINNPADISLSLISIFDYLRDVNSINRSHKTFVIPSIVNVSIKLAKEVSDDFEFLPKSKVILPKLEHSGLEFTYGCGIEDPHIWNFRIVNIRDKIQALTTDFDYFSDRINCFWELGYLYATFRWFKKTSFSLTCRSEEILSSLVQNHDLKAKFMFWLGVLSSYCGYRDSLRNLMVNDGISKLREQYGIIQQLDEKVSFLGNKLLWEID